MSKYFKLKDITEFNVTKVFGYKWKLWVEAENRMVESDVWFQGASKKYNLGVTVNGEQGYLEVSQNQLANMLEAFHKDGQSNIISQAFKVKTNGKTGMEIRYYINPVFVGVEHAPTNVQSQASPEQPPLPPEPVDSYDVNNVPF